MNTVPERLTAFRVYLEGSTDLKGVADIKLPSLEAMTETVKGAGIAGEYESPTIGHFKKMTMELKWRTVVKEMFKLLRQKAQRLEARGAMQEYDAAAGSYVVRSVRVVVQGIATKLETGKFETGGQTDGSTEIEVLYLKIDIDGTNYVEIDKLNYKCVIDGVDYLADVRSALGV